jgi:outer membrane protein assembly factor BamB
VAGAQASFNNLDELFYTVKSERMRADIVIAVAAAQREGRQHLRLCEFEQARKLYQTAWEKADAVADQAPRKYFLDLLNWMEQRNIQTNMRRERDKIDAVVRTLAEVQEYRRKGNADIAYRLLRDLVSEHRLIEFERQYSMPYRIVSIPQGASVYLNDEPAGKTPCSIEMDIVRRAHLRIERAGFHDEERRLLPTDETLTGTLEVALKKKLGWSREVGGLIEARPVIHEGTLLMATNRASLLALDLSDGRVKWEAKTRLLDRIKVPPIVAGGQAYLLTAEGRLQLVRLSDGALLGEIVQLPGKIHHAAAFDGDHLYVGLANLRLLKIRGTRVVYDIPLEEPPSTGLLYHDGRIYIGTTKGVILMHDAATGRQIGKMTAPSGSSFFAGLTRHGNLLLAGAEDGRLYAFDMKTGALQWDYATSGPITAPATSDGTVIYLPARDGQVHTLRSSGRHAISYEVGSAVEHQPALDNGFLYAVGGFRIRAFNVVDEAGWWSRTFRDEQAQHVVAGGGYIVVITDKPWIYAFEKDVR